MAETVHEIAAHIDRTRERLGSNLKELERRVESATDWRAQFRARPFAGLGLACAGGALMAAFLYSRALRRPPRPLEARVDPLAERGSDARGQARDLWNDIKQAFIGLAGARLKEQIDTLLPGFGEHVKRAEQRRGSASHSA